MEQLINGTKYHTITENGIIRNTKTNKIRKPYIAKCGYYVIEIYENGRILRDYIHRLLAKHFIPNPENKPQINHKDGNKLNNTLDNLEWCTNSENIKHAFALGLNVSPTCLTYSQVETIWNKFKQGTNLTLLAKEFNVSLTAISVSLNKYVKHNKLETEFNEVKYKQKCKRQKETSKTKCIKIIMLDKNNNILQSFNSLHEASVYLNKKSSGPISNVLHNRQTYAYGYKWKFA